MLRQRRLVVQPGGVVSWHAPNERPANTYVLSGRITEYRSTCAVPVEHRRGDMVAESGAASHWWRNNGWRNAVLLSADILPPQGKPEQSMYAVTDWTRRPQQRGVALSPRRHASSRELTHERHLTRDGASARVRRRRVAVHLGGDRADRVPHRRRSLRDAGAPADTGRALWRVAGCTSR
jgi:quercetin dioxygenase-like cupin family protein